MFNRDVNANIVIQFTDVTQLTQKTEMVQEQVTSEKTYASMVEFVLKRPPRDHQLLMQLNLLRENIRDLHKSLNAIFGNDMGGTLAAERDVTRRLNDLRMISQFTTDKIPVKPKSVDAIVFLEQYISSFYGQLVIDKLIDPVTLPPSSYLLCDPEMTGTIIDMTRFIIQHQLDASVNRITINAIYDSSHTELLLRYTYTGNAWQQEWVRFVSTRTNERVVHDLMKSEQVDEALALIILRGYMDALGASLKFSNDRNSRDRYVVELAVPMTKSNFASSLGRNVRVLFADDNPLVLKIYQQWAVNQGHTVLTATNGVESIKVAQTQKPDIIFLDMQLPILLGVDVIKQIRQWEQANSLKRVPIIVVTGNRGRFPEANVIEVGADAYIDKPLSLEKYMTFVINFI